MSYLRPGKANYAVLLKLGYGLWRRAPSRLRSVGKAPVGELVDIMDVQRQLSCRCDLGEYFRIELTDELLQSFAELRFNV
jgi:hypothetical protein